MVKIVLGRRNYCISAAFICKQINRQQIEVCDFICVCIFNLNSASHFLIQKQQGLLNAWHRQKGKIIPQLTNT